MPDKWIFSDKAAQPSFTTQIDVATGGAETTPTGDSSGDITCLMRQLVAGQSRLLTATNRQNELLEEVLEQLGAAARQRGLELAQWKKANPRLARSCKAAAEKLGRIQTDFIDSLSDEIDENFELLQDGEFVLNEFVDRFGPRFVHLNTILQVLTQLGNAPDIVEPKKAAKE